MAINWDRIARGAWKAPTFTSSQIKAAQKAVKAMPSPDKDPNHIASLWPQGDGYPDISQIDFGDAVQAVWDLTDLRAANGHDWLNRSKVIARIAKPGDSMLTANPFTAFPIICQDDDGELLIVDGHHRLAALMILGASQWQLWTIPVSSS